MNADEESPSPKKDWFKECQVKQVPSKAPIAGQQVDVWICSADMTCTEVIECGRMYVKDPNEGGIKLDANGNPEYKTVTFNCGDKVKDTNGQFVPLTATCLREAPLIA